MVGSHRRGDLSGLEAGLVREIEFAAQTDEMMELAAEFDRVHTEGWLPHQIRVSDVPASEAARPRGLPLKRSVRGVQTRRAGQRKDHEKPLPYFRHCGRRDLLQEALRFRGPFRQGTVVSKLF